MNSIGKNACSVTAAAVLTMAAPAVARADSTLQYRGQSQLARGMAFDDTVIGGLSAISYDAARNVYYAISDDKADHGNVRFYSLHVALSGNGIDDVRVLGMHSLLDESGRPFGPDDFSVNPPTLTPDAEAIAFEQRAATGVLDVGGFCVRWQ
jgi:hypothetical protein